MATTVKSGDTLWAIAQRVLGSGSRWRELLGPSGLPANFNPRFLQIGTVIKTAAEVKAAAPKAAPTAAKAAPKASTAVSKTSVPVLPGLQAEQFEKQLTLEKFIADQLAQLERDRIALQEQRDTDARRLTEAQLGANPADFVAFELYKRSLQEQGFDTQSPVRSDTEIQDLFSLALDLEKQQPPGIEAPRPGEPTGGFDRFIDPDRVGRLGEDMRGLFPSPPQASISNPDVLGTGQFGVDIPTTGSISRSQFQGFNPTDIGILSSFLRGGVEVDDGFQGINPEDFFTELGEGFVPTLTPQRTQFRF
ncbi:hypothetical protein LCGC14_2561850 [marine sediment metagenome]|uniref:LysM domain-containing protein n=1 Tax=marine sediment metagenome TaxID=412755 RepID=A0A0F9DCY3_9ZZZZ